MNATIFESDNEVTFEMCEMPSINPLIDPSFSPLKPVATSPTSFSAPLYLFLFFATYPFIRSFIKRQFPEPEPEPEPEEPEIEVEFNPDTINNIFGMFEEDLSDEEEDEALENILHMFDNDDPLTFHEKYIQPFSDPIIAFINSSVATIIAVTNSIIDTEDLVYSSIVQFLSSSFYRTVNFIKSCVQFLKSCYKSMCSFVHKCYVRFTRFVMAIYYYFRSFVVPGMTLHLVGIAVPEQLSVSKHNLFDNINHDTLLSVYTGMRPWNTIADLKKFLRKTYQVDEAHELLVVFSQHVLVDNEQTLESLQISNNTLLTLAICPNVAVIRAPPVPVEPVPPRPPTPTPPPAGIRMMEDYEYESDPDSDYHDEVNAVLGMYDSDSDSEHDPVTDVNELFGMFKYYNSEDESEVEPTPEPEPTPAPPVYPRLGFDVIMQEDNVLVHKMPCGHEMNHESLYHYALSNFMDNNNTSLKCPHIGCGCKWEYKDILNVLKYNCNMDLDWLKHAKLQMLASRNIVEDRCDAQKCPKCNTLYYRNHEESRKSLDDIKSIEDVEAEFKFHCVLCEPGQEEVVVSLPNPDKPKPIFSYDDDDDDEEDIDGQAVSAIFGMFNEEEDEDTDDEQQDALETISHMFDDDEPDFIDVTRTKEFNGFCFCCREQWVEGHVCSSSFKQDMCTILEHAEPKRIGQVKDVPSVRACPTCSQLIFHTDACKHMNCKNCRTDFCFVCLRPAIKGQWQCGSHSDVCPIHPRQDMDTLPDTIVITKKAFRLY